MFGRQRLPWDAFLTAVGGRAGDALDRLQRVVPGHPDQQAGADARGDRRSAVRHCRENVGPPEAAEGSVVASGAGLVSAAGGAGPHQRPAGSHEPAQRGKLRVAEEDRLVEDHHAIERQAVELLLLEQVEGQVAPVARLRPGDQSGHAPLFGVLVQLAGGARVVEADRRHAMHPAQQRGMCDLEAAQPLLGMLQGSALRGRQVQVAPAHGQRPAEAHGVGTVGVEHAHRRDAAPAADGEAVGRLDRPTAPRVADNGGVVVLLEDPVEVGQVLQRHPVGIPVQHPLAVVGSQRADAEPAVVVRDRLVEGRSRGRAEPQPGDVGRIVVVSVPAFPGGSVLREIVTGLLPEQGAADGAGAGVAGAEPLDVVGHDAVDPGRVQRLQVGQVGAPVVGIVETEGPALVVVAARVGRARPPPGATVDLAPARQPHAVDHRIGVAVLAQVGPRRQARPALAEPLLDLPLARLVDRVVGEMAGVVLGHADAGGVAGGHHARQRVGQQLPVAAKGPAEVGGAEGDDVVDADPGERLRLARQVGIGVVKDLLVVVPEEGEARVPRVEMLHDGRPSLPAASRPGNTGTR